MVRKVSHAIALLSALSVTQPASARDMPALSAADRAAVRCSAAFAIVAGQQERGAGDAQGWPPLGWRGREYMVATGERLRASGWTRDEVSAAMRDAAAALQAEAREAGDGEAVLAAVMPPCLALLETQVPPLTQPNLPQCAAILRLSYEEVHAGEGLSARARDLLTLATVLEARARRELTEQGRTAAEADAILALEAESVANAAAEPGGVGRYDVATCFDLAKPEEKTHY